MPPPPPPPAFEIFFFCISNTAIHLGLNIDYDSQKLSLHYEQSLKPRANQLSVSNSHDMVNYPGLYTNKVERVSDALLRYILTLF